MSKPIKQMTYKQVLSVAQLKELCRDEQREFFILLNGGIRSSKSILYNTDDRMFEILNNIDDTEQILSESELLDEDETNIGKAILAGSFYQY